MPQSLSNSKAALLLVAVASCGFIFNAPKDTAPSRTSDLTDGLKIWRKPGSVQGGAACATCHSPDGIELAVYGFSDANILRRAKPHLGNADSQRLLTYIHALRLKLDCKVMRDPDRDRPLQPGGEVLPGKDAASRDSAFGLELSARLPLLFGKPIETEAEAKAAENQLLALSPTTLRIGIPLNRISEDVAHGNEHSTIAQWLPESAPGIPPARLQDWYAAEDRYLSNPSQEELRNLLVFHTELVDPYRQLGLQAISTLKFRALLVLQNRMRHKQEVQKEPLSEDVRGPGLTNPIWEVGEMARELIDRDPKSLGMNADVQSKKLAGEGIRQQLSKMRLSWFWSGWLADQGLYKTSRDDKTRLGLWMAESLSEDGPYPIHSVYAAARRQAVISNDVASWSGPIAKRLRLWDFGALRIAARHIIDMPKAGEHRRLYTKFTANCFRMNLLLLKRALEEKHQIWARLNAKLSAKEMLDFVEAQEPATHVDTRDLGRQLATLIDGAEDVALRPRSLLPQGR